MKIIAHDIEEFEELVRTFKYLHDVTHWEITGINWKFWQWFSNRTIFNYQGRCLNLEEYPLLNSIAHLYRIKHAHLETNGLEESEYLKKLFVIDTNCINLLEEYKKMDSMNHENNI